MLEPDPPDGAGASQPGNKDALTIQCQSTEIDCVEKVVFVENNNSASQEVVVGDIVCGDTCDISYATVANDYDAAACVSIPPEEHCEESVDVEMKDHEDAHDHLETMPGTLSEHSYGQPDNREPLSPELQHGFRILKEIMSDTNKSVNWPFIYAVDDTEEGLEDYYERVKQPMWLQRIEEKFETREYTSITEFVGDMRLMLENCYRYNGASHQVSKKAQRLEIVLEQKLTLLSRALREKTSIAATSGHALIEQQITGTRRRVVLTPHDSSLLLNQIRQEEQERQREQRRLHMAERKNQQEAYLQELQTWEDQLLGDGRREQMQAMWEIAQIGHFLFLCAMPLNLGEIIHYELERCFLMPRESSTMQRVMTFLISTPYQRTRLENKPAMPYSVWEEKLRGKLRNWYKTLADNHQDTNKTIQKLGLEEKFFHVLGMRNPMEKKKYHELTFYQRVWVMKSLCDFCLETQQSIRDAIETQSIDDQHAYLVGSDADGNNYLHFPQFCGADLRIYRQSPIRWPKMERLPQKQEMLSDIKLLKLLSSNRKSPRKKTKKKKPAPPPEAASPPPSTPRYRDSRLRQNPKTVITAQPSTPGGSSGAGSSESDSDSGISENDVDSEEPTSRRSTQTKHQLKIRTPEFIRSGQLTEAMLARSWRRNHDHTESSDGTPTPSRDSTPTPPVWRGHHWKDVAMATPSRGSSPSIRGSCVADPDSCASTPAPSVVGDIGSDSCCSMPAGDVTVSNRKKRSRRKVGWNRQRRAKKRLKVSKCDEDIETVSENHHTHIDIPFDVCTNVKDEGEQAKTGQLQGETNCQGTEGDDVHAMPDKDGCLQCGSEAQGKSQCEKNIQQNVGNISVGNDSGTRDVVDKTDGVETGSISSKCGDGQTCFDFVKTELPEAGVNTNCSAVNGYISDRSEVGMIAKTTCQAEDAKHAFIESKVDNNGHLKVDNCEIKKEIDSNMISTETATIAELPSACSEVKLETNNQCNGVLLENYKSDIKVKTETEVSAAEGIHAQLHIHTGNLVVPKSETTLKVENSREIPAPDEEGKADQETAAVVDVKEESDEEIEEVLPDLREFELVVDGVNSLKRLVVQFAELEPYELGTGKKKRLITPPPRKRCVVELHKRLLFLQKELEPWEHKLQQATKRARIKLKKEQGTYKEATEKEKVDDIWESEEEGSAEEEEDASDVESSACEQEAPKHDSISSQVVAPPAAAEQGQVELEKSSRGRIRKRRLIPTDAKDQHVKKRRKTEPANNSEQTMPQKLVGSSAPDTKALPVPIRLTQFTGAQNSLLNLNLLNKHGIQLRFQSPASVATSQMGQSTSLNLSAENATLLAQLSTQQVHSSKSPSGKTGQVLPAQGQQIIKALLSSGRASQNPASNTPPKLPYQCMTVTPSGSQPLNVVPTKGSLTSTPQHVVRSSSGPAYVVLPNANAVRQVSPVKVVRGAKTPGVSTLNLSEGNNPMAAAGPRFFQYNSLSELPPGLIQHILKTQDSRIKGQNKVVPAANTTMLEASTAEKNTLLMNLIKAGVLPVSATLPQCNLSQTQTSSKTTPKHVADSTGVCVDSSSDTTETSAMVKSPTSSQVASTSELTKTGQVNPELLSRLSASCESGGLTTVQFSPQRAPKYASNVTVKTLLESRAAATQQGHDGVKDVTASLAEAEASPVESNMQMTSKYNVTIKPTAPVAMATAVKSPKIAMVNVAQGNPDVGERKALHPVVLPDGAPKVVTLPVTVAQQLLQPQLLLSAISQPGGKNAPVGGLPQLCLQLRPAASAAVAHHVSAPGVAVPQLQFQLQAATTTQPGQLVKPGRTTMQRVIPVTVAEATKQVLTVLNSGATSGSSMQLQQAAFQKGGHLGGSASNVSSGHQPISSTAAILPSTVSLRTSPVTGEQPVTCVQHLAVTSSSSKLQKTASHPGTPAPPSVGTPRGTAPQQVMVLPQGVVLTPQLLQQLATVRGQQPGSLVLQYGKGGTTQLVRAPVAAASPRGVASGSSVQKMRGYVSPGRSTRASASPVKIRVPVNNTSRTKTHVIRLPLPTSTAQMPTVHMLRAPGLFAVSNNSANQAQMNTLTTPTLRAPGLVAVPHADSAVAGKNVSTSSLSMALARGPRFSAQPAKLNMSNSAPSLSLAVTRSVGVNVNRSISSENTLSTSRQVAPPVSVGCDHTVSSHIINMLGQVATRGGVSDERVVSSQQLLARTSGLSVVMAPFTAESIATLNSCNTKVSHCALVESNSATTLPTAQPTNRPHSNISTQQPFILTTSPMATTVMQTVATSNKPRHVHVQQMSPVKAMVPSSVGQSGTIVRLIRMQSPEKKGKLATRPHLQQHSVARLPGTTCATQVHHTGSGVQSPSKLVLYNVGGQLVTAQGIPVSLPISLPPGMTTARVTVAGPVRLPCVGDDHTTVLKTQTMLASGGSVRSSAKGESASLVLPEQQQSTVLITPGESPVTPPRSLASGSGLVYVSKGQRLEAGCSGENPLRLQSVMQHSDAASPVSFGKSQATPKKPDHVDVSNNRTVKGAACAATDSDCGDASRKEHRVSTSAAGGMVGDATDLPSSGETGLGLLSQAAALQQAFSTTGTPSDDGSSLQTSSQFH